jgi:hypothetical protein
MAPVGQSSAFDNRPSSGRSAPIPHLPALIPERGGLTPTRLRSARWGSANSAINPARPLSSGRPGRQSRQGGGYGKIAVPCLFYSRPHAVALAKRLSIFPAEGGRDTGHRSTRRSANDVRVCSCRRRAALAKVATPGSVGERDTGDASGASA